jgi:hypothetical protein
VRSWPIRPARAAAFQSAAAASLSFPAAQQCGRAAQTAAARGPPLRPGRNLGLGQETAFGPLFTVGPSNAGTIAAADQDRTAALPFRWNKTAGGDFPKP